MLRQESFFSPPVFFYTPFIDQQVTFFSRRTLTPTATATPTPTPGVHARNLVHGPPLRHSRGGDARVRTDEAAHAFSG